MKILPLNKLVIILNKIFKNSFFEVKSLRVINADNSNIVKIIDKNKKNFHGIAEIYSSNFKKNTIRAWKKHTKMYCNIFVTKGSVKFKFYDDNFIKSNELILGENDKKILFIKPNIWFGFKGLSENNSLVNISNILHDDKEVVKKKYDSKLTKF